VIRQVLKERGEGAECVAEVDVDICGGCLVCMEVCEPKTIDIDGLSMTAKIIQENCTGCGECEESCSTGAIFMVPNGPIRQVG
jgi:NAD-dependent dihydropyrimidine dehydrogenase PreA subunit